MFDAVLLISFGGPQGRDDIRPFLANVLRGRRVTPERVEEVAHHYELFDGVSPLTKLTELMQTRAPLYESLADFTIATDGRKVHVVAEAIFAAFRAAQQTA